MDRATILRFNCWGMLRIAVICCFAVASLSSTEVFDRVVAVVGRNAITASDVNQRLRLESFINQQEIDDSAENRRRVLERLIEVSLISQEMKMISFLEATEEDVEREMRDVRKQEFPGGLSFEEALDAYGLKEEDVRDFLRRQINVLRFIDFRFRTGLQVTEIEIREYYEDFYAPEVRRLESREPEPLDEIRPQLREIVVRKKVNAAMDDWLKRLRATTRVVYAEEGLGGRP